MRSLHFFKPEKILVYSFMTFLVLFANEGMAENSRRFIDISNTPLESPSLNNFVPQGWIIEKKVEGDLNGDTKPDVILQLIEDLPAKSQEKRDQRYRAMIVLFGAEGGKFRRAEVADRLLPCSDCGGTYANPAVTPNIKISRGVIVIEAELGGGSRETCSYVQRFRYDTELKHFVLIGYDANWLSDNHAESTNYLTGTKLIKRYRYDERRGKDVLFSTKKETVSKEKKIMERSDYEDYSCL